MDPDEKEVLNALMAQVEALEKMTTDRRKRLHFLKYQETVLVCKNTSL